MLRIVLIISIFLLGDQARGQVRFKTIAPQQAVTAGESFQVQYVLEDAKKLVAINPPDFTGFRFVAGPNNYSGNVSSIDGSKPVFNAVYTLEAIRPGHFHLKGAATIVNGKVYRSNDVVIEVIGKQEALRRLSKNYEAGNSAYFLRPGEDAYKKIRENLFVKVMVDKRTCFAGEPLLATFKLYSRLESKSDIIKNPGFYGFTVYDMVSLNDRESIVEDINGKKFDVHTIRKVQLFPLQAGLFTIDPMEIKNRVEFSRSLVNKSTEQEIVEGVLGPEEDSHPAEGTELFETTIRTEPVSVRVKPIPVINQPESFSGAIGHFTISAALKKDKLGLNEQGAVEITISGVGNFVQLDAPVIKWPEGMEGFPATVNDQFDKTKIPLAGSRTFIYPFVGVKTGTWNLEPVRFSFFDLDSNSFNTVRTSAIKIEVSPVANYKRLDQNPSDKKAGKGRNGILLISTVLLFLIAALVWIYKKKRSKRPLVIPAESARIGDNLLQPAYAALKQEGNYFYVVLQGILWKHLSKKFGVAGSLMTKTTISKILADKGIPGVTSAELVSILEHLETGIFTGTDPETSKEDLLTWAKKVIESLS